MTDDDDRALGQTRLLACAGLARGLPWAWPAGWARRIEYADQLAALAVAVGPAD